MHENKKLILIEALYTNTFFSSTHLKIIIS